MSQIKLPFKRRLRYVQTIQAKTFYYPIMLKMFINTYHLGEINLLLFFISHSSERKIIHFEFNVCVPYFCHDKIN